MLEYFTGNGFVILLVVIAGLLHASLQLPLATVTHVATHALGKNKLAHVLSLSFLVILGHVAAIAAMSIVAIALLYVIGTGREAYGVIGALTVVAGLGILLAYFRQDDGAQLWVPRWFTLRLFRLSERSSLPEMYGHAATAGFLATLAEMLFSFPLALCVAVLAVTRGAPEVPVTIGVYCFFASIPLLMAAGSLWAGVSPVRIHRWRIEGKRFWQFFIGLLYILFGLYVATGQFAALAVQQGVRGL